MRLQGGAGGGKKPLVHQCRDLAAVFLLGWALRRTCRKCFGRTKLFASGKLLRNHIHAAARGSPDRSVYTYTSGQEQELAAIRAAVQGKLVIPNWE